MSTNPNRKKSKKCVDAEKLRDILLGCGDDLLQADIDPFRLDDPEYIRGLSPMQRQRFKSVSFHREGGISRVEFNTGLDIVKGLADIGGVRVKTSSDDENKYRSKPLTIRTETPKSPSSKSQDSQTSQDDSVEKMIREINAESAPSDSLEKMLQNIDKWSEEK